MSLLKKIFGKKIPAHEKRKSPRKQLKEIFKIHLTIDGKRYRIYDFSNIGIALFNEDSNALSIGKIYSAELVAHGQKRSLIKLKVVRKNDHVFGCEVIDQETFRSFKDDYLMLAEKE